MEQKNDDINLIVRKCPYRTTTITRTKYTYIESEPDMQGSDIPDKILVQSTEDFGDCYGPTCPLFNPTTNGCNKS